MVTYRAWLEGQTTREDDVGEFARRLAAMDPPPRAWTPTGVLNHIKRIDYPDPAAEEELIRQHAVSVEDYRKHRGDLQAVPLAGEELPHPEEPPGLREMILEVQTSLTVQSALLSLVAQRLGIEPAEITQAVAYSFEAMAEAQKALAEAEQEPADFGAMWHDWSLAERAGTVQDG